MKHIMLTLLLLSGLVADNFTLESKDLKGQLTKTQEFNSFGCSGENKSPQLQWSNAPKGTKSFAITVYDPDAPTANSIATDASNTKKLPKGALETINDYGTTNFGGACPPEGDKAHTYIFTVYALDVEKLDLNEKSDSALVGYMINKHTIQKATVVSYYQR